MSNENSVSDEFFTFADESLATQQTDSGTEIPWPILIVDDEEEVHEATRFALQGVDILDRPLECYSAYSAVEACELLKKHPDFACILLDVVMESEQAGLELISYIRETLEYSSLRIILRTGQPGYAPELEVVNRYDINDYKQKNELSRTRLITSLTSALRSYQQIQVIERSRQGLALIIESAPRLFLERSASKFAKGVLIQLCSLLGIDENGFICCHEDVRDQQVKILAGLGRYSPWVGQPIEKLGDAGLQKEVEKVLQNQESCIEEDHITFYIRSPHKDELVVRIETRRPLSEMDIRLIKLFSVNVAVGFDNAQLFEQVEHLAFIDPLTSLPNRSAFIRLLEQTIAVNQPFTLLLADLDNFQAVNDGLGHQVGDETLQLTSELLGQTFGQNCELARLSADSFCLLIPGKHITELTKQLQKLQWTLDEGLTVRGYEIPLSITWGAALYPDHAKKAGTLLQNASIAMKDAKANQRGGLRLFNKGFDQVLQQRLQTASELRHSVARSELELHFQPQIALKTSRLVGAEALLRWRRNGELVSPVDFIPAAESSGHIVSIGAWVLEEACRQQLHWQQETGLELTVAVNVSMRQLLDVHFLEMLTGVVQKTGINPKNLELEITETVMMENAETVVDLLAEVRDLGVQIAIDDFGTGYSSLSYLQQLTVDRLKIDRSFVQLVAEQDEARVIAAMIVKMGQLLGFKVLAEGVETSEQLAELKKLGCDEVQGFYYAKPMAADAWLEYVNQLNC
ncbi:diguanylate cyclase (GGDEF) domain-containing protein [Marinospirillum celere]|uniref:Diguanylate cyclase (GGDEF) domain-containing protein n=1 Tax=Marinospirillum celere TaxID=1122252 RepID=A0A1I1ERK5_9GAMM|nr:EAL domain-containing protein [Marinospirillum celere]SFB87523.1 diguanylate cyclase (GGDEF) domain-containing protein [Marinospirillum celere]